MPSSRHVLLEGPHRREVADEIEALTHEVDARIAALSTELAAIESDLRTALTEMIELGNPHRADYEAGRRRR